MEILILGGTGAMGKALVQELNREENTLTVTSRSVHASASAHVQYVQGNAKDEGFLARLLTRSYDSIVDFMSYSTAEFAGRMERLLSATRQYVFFSSARVYKNTGGGVHH